MITCIQILFQNIIPVCILNFKYYTNVTQIYASYSIINRVEFLRYLCIYEKFTSQLNINNYNYQLTSTQLISVYIDHNQIDMYHTVLYQIHQLMFLLYLTFLLKINLVCLVLKLAKILINLPKLLVQEKVLFLRTVHMWKLILHHIFQILNTICMWDTKKHICKLICCIQLYVVHVYIPCVEE